MTSEVIEQPVDAAALPETEEKLEHVSAPLSAWQARAKAWGFTDEQIAAAGEVKGDVYSTHKAYDHESACSGSLRMRDKGEPHWIVECDVCRVEVAINMRKADPERMVGEWLDAAEIPELYRGKALDSDDPLQKPALDVCREWIKTFRRSPMPAVALYGETGRGKSHLLALMIETVISVHHGRGLYRSAVGMLDELTEGFDAGEYEKRWRRLLTVPVLGLDDLGVERMTDWRKERLGELVDVRYRNGRPLLIATNLRPDEWQEKFGPRTASRLRGMCVVLELKGRDRRAQGVQQTLEA